MSRKNGRKSNEEYSAPQGADTVKEIKTSSESNYQQHQRYAQRPLRRVSNQQNQYQQNPYQQYPNQPYQQNPYQQYPNQPYQQNPYQQNPNQSYQQNPYQQYPNQQYQQYNNYGNPQGGNYQGQQMYRQMNPNGNQMQRNPSAKNKGSGKKKKKKKTLGQSIRNLFPLREDSVGERIRKLVFLGSVVAIIICGYLVADYYLDLWKSRQLTDSIKNIYITYDRTDDNEQKSDGMEKYYTLLDGARKLLDMNEDSIGFITIEGTPIQNPVVKSTDNNKYLNLNFYGEESRAGTIFLDWRCNFDVVENHKLLLQNADNLVVYGHNMGDESMFGCLKYYQRNYNYYIEHPIIEFNSNYEVYKYKIFGVILVDAFDESDTKFDCWNKLYFDGENDFYEFVNEVKRRNIVLNDVDVKFGDPLLTLSTCNTTLGDNGRLLIIARRVRDGEDLLAGTQNASPNTNVKYPNLYYQTKSNESYDPTAPFEPYGP
ncbi:MAG: class B sortase [Ruminococcus sp.]|nr:class B sortase [Ruminococcus sp.]